MNSTLQRTTTSGMSIDRICTFTWHLSNEFGEQESLGRMHEIILKLVRSREAIISDRVWLSRVVTGYILDASRRAYSSLAKGAEPSGVVIGMGEDSGREDTWACTMIPSSLECLSAARDGLETSFDTNPSNELRRSVTNAESRRSECFLTALTSKNNDGQRNKYDMSRKSF